MTAHTQTITVKIRLRDKHASELNRQARAVNFVWNYCNDVQKKTAQAHRKWLSAFDLQRLTAGSSKELNIHAHTIQRVCGAYYEGRKQHKKPWLRWRSRKSLGWVPFNTGHVKFDGERFTFRDRLYEPMHLSPHLVAGIKIGAGSFNADAKGNWYVNVPVTIACAQLSPSGAVGIDLGLKTIATLSGGDKVEMPRFYRESEIALATAQKARKTRRARAIHAKARNRRKDFLHKLSAGLSSEYGTIVVGDVSSGRLAKTHLAKSVYDAGWAGFKDMLAYKSIRNGGKFLEVSEAYTTQTCSACSLRGGPRGLKGLAMREWACLECETVHDRDVNAAKNILGIGLDTLAGGTSHVG